MIVEARPQPASLLDTSPNPLPPGYWEFEGSHNPKPLTPLGQDVVIAGIEAGFKTTFTDFGLLLEGLEYRTVNGYVYVRSTPAGGGADRPLPPKPLFWLLVRVIPELRRRAARCKFALETGLDRQYIERWYSEWRPRLIAETERYRAIDLGAMSDAELATHIRELKDWLWDAIDIHFMLTPGFGFPLATLAFFTRDHLGWDDTQMLRLTAGLSTASSEPAIELEMLVRSVPPAGQLRDDLLAAEPRNVAALLRERAPQVAVAYDAYVHKYGFRALRYEVAEPTLGEDPETLGMLFQDEVRRAATGVGDTQASLAAQRAQAKAEALKGLPTAELKREFEGIVADLERTYPVREDNEFYTVSVPLAVFSAAARVAGERLESRDVLAVADDFAFLRYDELLAALEGSSGTGQPDYAERVYERRARHRAAESWSPPASYGTQPPIPPMSVLPKHLRIAMEALLYVRDKVFDTEASNNARHAIDARELSGRAAARGTYEGTARVIMGEDEFDRLQAGDVLVCPITSPVWSVLFAKVGALVTDAGGILSHPAIIAREYGIPAVVGTGNGTAVIRDGARISVDGTNGTIRVLD